MDAFAETILVDGAEKMGRKILLIEDDSETASYLLRGLAEEGHSVDHASDGRDGLFLATDGRDRQR